MALAAVIIQIKSPSRVRPVFSAFVRSYRKVSRLEDLPDSYLLPTVAIVGRPNVGKSALFNRLVRKRDALVFDTPGGHVTRDYREGLGQLADLSFRLLDTSGLEPTAHPTSLQGRAAALTRGVLQHSHGVLMLLDARQGLVPSDEELLGWLRRHCRAPLLLLANKLDTAAGRNNLDQLQADLAGVGWEPATPISATSGEGMADLYQLLQPLVDGAEQQQQQQQHEAGPRKGASTSSSRHAPGDFRFSGRGLLQQRPDEQQQQQGLQQDSELAGDAAVARDAAQAQQQEAAEQTAAAAAAAAEQAEVDRLVQQQLAAATGSDSDLENAAAAAAAAGGGALQPNSSSSSDVEEEAEEEEEEDAAAAAEGPAAAAAAAGPLRMAILGLPNAGKSTLMNTLLGYERSLTGPEPGLTRDPTSGWLQHAGLTLQLVDTAGWKRPNAAAPTQSPTAALQKVSPASAAGSRDSSRDSDVDSGRVRGKAGATWGVPTPKVLADASLLQARRALSAVHVAVLLLDAPRLLTIGQAITRLELQLAGLALQQGKALVIGLNKADAVPGGAAAAEALREQVAEALEARFLQAGRLPVVALSALQGQGSEALLAAVADAYSKWNKRVSSHKLRASLAKHALRFYGTGGTAGLLQRVKWATQLKPRPPTFVLLLRGSEEVDEGGQRFLANLLRQSVGLQGVPLRLYLRYNKRPPAQRQQHSRGRGRGRGRSRGTARR
uniref:GTPase Der n=1 Tax=Tetradesmus obliquus TaxID=3088 RepID=A0A383WHR0_TETOB|eukprot:jgi/Sobl393_1/8324/SZX76961.1